MNSSLSNTKCNNSHGLDFNLHQTYYIDELKSDNRITCVVFEFKSKCNTVKYGASRFIQDHPEEIFSKKNHRKTAVERLENGPVEFELKMRKPFLKKINEITKLSIQEHEINEFRENYKKYLYRKYLDESNMLDRNQIINNIIKSNITNLVLSEIKYQIHKKLKSGKIGYGAVIDHTAKINKLECQYNTSLCVFLVLILFNFINTIINPIVGFLFFVQGFMILELMARGFDITFSVLYFMTFDILANTVYMNLRY